MKNFNPTISFILALSLLTIIYYLSKTFLFQPKGFLTLDNNSLLYSFIIGFVTFLGIYCQFIYSELKSKKSKTVKIGSIFKSTFKSKSFWMSIFVSPIVLMGVYKGIEEVPDNFLSFVFAFENGFFFNSILKITDDQ